MNEKNSDQLNAAQIQAVQKHTEANMRAILTDLELRKLALRHACDIDGVAHGLNVVKLAQEMHAFLTGGAKQP